VQVRAKHERAGRRIAGLRAAPAGDAPAGQRAREFRDVGLRVTRAYAERVQFHDFAREILVEPAPARRIARFGTQRGRAVRADRARLVEEELHRGMLLDGDQHVLETAEHVRADRVALERARIGRHRPLVDRYREMVRPEMHETLDERRGRVQRAVEPRDHGAAIRVVAVTPDRLLGRALRCRIVAGDRIARVREARGERHRVGFAGPRSRPRVVTVELRNERRLRVGRRHFVGTRAETEAVQRDGGRCDVVRVVHDGALAMRTRV